MDLVTEPVAKIPRHADIHTANDWLDAISAGNCNRTEFFLGVDELLRRAPDTGWELLALLDQYYRRGKITAETFGSLKPPLQNLLMGKSGDISQSQPRAAGARVSAPVPSPAAIPRTSPKAARAPAAASVKATMARAATAATARVPPTLSVPVLSEPVRSAPVRSAPVRSAAIVSKPASTAGGEEEPSSDAADATGRAERSIQVGSVLRDRYRIEGVLGQGGMGTVFDAVDEFRLDQSHGDQRVAIKVLHTAVTHRPRLFAELRREFQHLQSLSHPNIVRVHEFDRDGDTAFFTMERLSGAALSRILTAHRNTPLSRDHAFAILHDVGAAVVHAHAHGVVHGDLNPVNIFVTDGGEVRVLDFGAAHQMRRGPWISDFNASQADVPVATPSYASCQLLEGEPADIRDDAYALACVAYVLLTGKHPYREHSSLKARSLRMKPERPRGLNHRQWRALKSALEFDRARRPADLRVWLHQLQLQAPHLPPLPELLIARDPPRAFPRWMAAATVIACVAAGGGWLVTHRSDLWHPDAADGTALLATNSGAAGDTRTAADVASADVVSPPPPPPSITSPAAATAPSEAPGPRTAAAASARSRDAWKASAPAVSVTATTGKVVDGAASAAALPAVAPAANGVHARIELAADTVDVAPDDTTARILVRRSRAMRGDVSFKWWTESGTAKPGRDFVAVKSEVENIPDGKNSVTLFVPILADHNRRESRSFYIVIDEPSDNAVVGPRTLSMVTLPDVE